MTKSQSEQLIEKMMERINELESKLSQKAETKPSRPMEDWTPEEWSAFRIEKGLLGNFKEIAARETQGGWTSPATIGVYTSIADLQGMIDLAKSQGHDWAKLYVSAKTDKDSGETKKSLKFQSYLAK